VSDRRKPWAVGAVYLAIAVVSILHYVAPEHAHQLHDIYRRLYYLPIIVAAFQNGWLGGLIAAAVVCAAYAPHAFGHISHDPATPTQKVLEMALYFAVGLTTGSLVSRLKRTQTELRTSLEHLRSAEDELVRTARLAAVGHLSAGLAHEIRNPLASIKGSAELLADDFPAEHPKRTLLRALVDESVRLNNVLTRFLAFARPRPLEAQLFDLQPEIDVIVALFQSGDAAKTVRVFVEPCKVPARVRGDREQLRQVLLNVLLNAAQAAGSGGVVQLSCDAMGGVFRIRVRDSGPGFTQEALDNAFTPFFTTKNEGTGLGLALSHRIIDSHGGKIRLSNRPEGGGLVEIEIPLGGEGG
jgi:signal transduction histidine kinase